MYHGEGGDSMEQDSECPTPPMLMAPNSPESVEPPPYVEEEETADVDYAENAPDAGQLVVGGDLQPTNSPSPTTLATEAFVMAGNAQNAAGSAQVAVETFQEIFFPEVGRVSNELATVQAHM